jgi:hypothetical protein
MQTKDITDATVLDAIAAVRVKDWTPWRPPWPSLSDVQSYLNDIHPKLVLSKLRSMVKRGVILGCGCGCRGNFEIPVEIPGPVVPLRLKARRCSK